MSEMVKRVGAAIAKDQVWPPWANTTEVGRAAIDAMRPSKEFIWEAVYNLRPMLNCIRGHDLTSDEAYRIFNAVIDAALKEEP